MSSLGKVWYFAYGSNVNTAQLRKRIGEWRLSKRAALRNYKLVFNHFSKTVWNGYTANIQPSEKFDDVVHGVVYLINQEQLQALQKVEGVAPIEVGVELEDGNEIHHVRTFLWQLMDKEGEPPKAYRELIEEGLIQHGYDRTRVNQIFSRFAQKP